MSKLSPKADWTPTYPATKPFDPPVEILVKANGGYKWKEGESYTNNPYAWMREELLGIKYAIKWEAYGDVATQKLKADLAAGDPPDMWVVGRQRPHAVDRRRRGRRHHRDLGSQSPRRW